VGRRRLISVVGGGWMGWDGNEREEVEVEVARTMYVLMLML
jgi:hypothetical protein